MGIEEELAETEPAELVDAVRVNPVQRSKIKRVNGSPLSGSSVPSCKREELGRLTSMRIEEELVS